MKRDKKQNWDLSDVIDLEFFFHQYNTEKAAGDLGASEREIYLKQIEPMLSYMPEGPEKRKAILRSWLQIKQREAALEKNTFLSGTSLPGERFRLIFKGTLLCLCAAGFFSGSALAATLLIYTGKAPVNVSVYIGLCIIIQILLLWLTAMAAALKHKIRFSTVSRMITPFFLKWMKGVRQRDSDFFSAHREGAFKAIAALLNGKRRVYGALFFWPFFILAQAFQLFFNTGVFFTTCLRVIGTDLAFGWQSTLHVSAQGFFKLVSFLALPWIWFVPEGISHPTLSQIEGSRIILKEGIHHLATSDMVSWWPFLLLGVFFYGILPRCGLFFIGVKALALTLRGLKLDTYDCDRLLMRLTTPQISEGRRLAEKERAASPVSMDAVLQKERAASPGEGLVVVIPSEICSFCQREALEQRIVETTGRKAAVIIFSDFDFSVDRVSISSQKISRTQGVLVLQESWQPPIRETLSYFREARLFLGPGVPLTILLVGKPEPRNIFTPVEDRSYDVWKQIVGGLSDPYTHVERIVA